MTTYLDAAGAVRDWVNSLTGSLVGQGNPLPLGASLKQREGAASVAYGFLFELPGTGQWGGAEHPSMSALLSMQIYGPTRQAASEAAVAYCEALEPLHQGFRAYSPSGVEIVGVASIDGPSWQPDGDEPRYIVDAMFLFA